MKNADVWGRAMEWAAELAETFARATDAEARKKVDPSVERAVARAMRTMAGVYRADSLRIPLEIDDDRTPAVGMTIPPIARK